ncbi:MAG: hypothetical protein IJS32_06155 [Kiritimatiellae bacterium]|nr:hypothetical protein [Kiritimatiellia bacterium]
MIVWLYLVSRFAGYGFAIAGLFASLHERGRGVHGADPLSAALLSAGFACFLLSCVLWMVLRRRRAKERAAARGSRRKLPEPGP